MYSIPLEETDTLPFASGGAAGGGGPTPTLHPHLSPHHSETLGGHTLPKGDNIVFQKHIFTLLLLYSTKIHTGFVYLLMDCSTSFLGEEGEERRRFC